MKIGTKLKLLQDIYYDDGINEDKSKLVAEKGDILILQFEYKSEKHYNLIVHKESNVHFLFGVTTEEIEETE